MNVPGKLGSLYRALLRTLTAWYVLAVMAVAVGVAGGLLAFMFIFPGKPKIGVIEIPYTVISEDSAYSINQFIDYARRDDSIKAVVIKLTSPGGGAASSERLYIETRRLREEKPVVISMDGLVASGGYMMAMGASYSYTQTSSLVGNVGVVAFSDPLIPSLPAENRIFTGPYKMSGFNRREWIGSVDQLKSAFAKIVVTERAGRLRISEDELVQGRIYSGLDAVRLGLADDLGGESDALRKAAELAGISRYGTVDVNLEVMRETVQELDQILASYGTRVDAFDLPAQTGARAPGSVASNETGASDAGGIATLHELRDLIRFGSLEEDREDPLPEFPLNIYRPNIYFLYVGNAP